MEEERSFENNKSNISNQSNNKHTINYDSNKNKFLAKTGFSHNDQLSNVAKLSHIKKKHKEINNLIHIYSHKVTYDVQPLTRKNKNHSLPLIQNRQMQSSHSPNTKTKNKSKIDGGNPKFSLEEEKLKLQKMKETVLKNKEKKQKEAKDMKEANRLMRENILIFKDRLKEENIQKKKIVDAKYQIIKNSIDNYKILKKDYIENIFADEIEKEMKDIYKKQNELAYLKVAHENKLLREKYEQNEKNHIKSKSVSQTSSTQNVNKDIKKMITLNKNKDTNTFMTDL